MANGNKRSVTLDLIRGLSAIFIVLFHYTCVYSERPDSTGVFETDWGWSVWWGYAAVTTFFMLSGFLVAPALVRGKTTPGRFLRKKAKRFYPVYWVAMTVTTLVLYFIYREEAIETGQYLANLTMVSQLFRVPFIDGVYWSMQCELMFCLICAGLLLIKRPENHLKVLGGWVVVAIVLSFVQDVKALRIVKIITICSYCQDFIAGIVLHSLVRDKKLRMKELWVLVLCLVNSIVWHGLFTPTTVFFVATALVLYFLSKLDEIVPASNPIVKGIVWIAGLSYPLYLIHEMVGFAIIRHMLASGMTHPLAILIPILIVIVIGWLIHLLVEKRIK